MADCSCDGPCADHPNCPPALTRTEPKAESIGSNPLSPVPEGLKDEMVEKAANALWPEFSGVKNPRPGSQSDKHLHRILDAITEANSPWPLLVERDDRAERAGNFRRSGVIFRVTDGEGQEVEWE